MSGVKKNELVKGNRDDDNMGRAGYFWVSGHLKGLLQCIP